MIDTAKGDYESVWVCRRHGPEEHHEDRPSCEDCPFCEIARLRAELADIQDAHRQVMEERCPTDERHCACVPVLRAEVAESARELLDLSARHESLLAALGHSESEVARLESIIQRNPDGSIDYARMVSSLQAKNARLVDSLRIECETSSEFLKENVKLRAVRDAGAALVADCNPPRYEPPHVSKVMALHSALAAAERKGG